MHVSLDDPAPEELQGTADATWGLTKDVFGYLAMRSSAAVLHGVKGISHTAHPAMRCAPRHGQARLIPFGSINGMMSRHAQHTHTHTHTHN